MKRLLMVFTFILFSCGTVQASDTIALNLEQSIQMALKGNASVLSSEKKMMAAKCRIWEMGGAFLPQITATGNYNYSSKVQGSEIAANTFYPGQPAISMSSGQQDVVILKAGASWNIFTWGRDFNSFFQTKANYNAEVAAYEKTKQDVKLEVLKNFYSLVLAEELIKVAQDSLESAQVHFEDTQKGSLVGTVTEVDLLKSEVQYLNMKSQLIKAKNRLTIAKNSFRVMLNLKEDAAIEVNGELLYAPYTIDLNEGINKAMLNHVGLKQIKYQKQAADLAVAIADGGDKPTISLNYNYEWDKGQTADNFWQDKWTAGAYMSVPLFDGLMTRSRVKQAEESRDAIKINEDSLIRNTKIEVQQIYFELKENQEIIAIQEKSVAQAKRAYSLTNIRYKQGLATNADLLDANTALVQAETNYLQSLYDYIVAQAKWKKATGEL